MSNGSFSRKISDVNIQQQNTSEVANIETAMTYNENLDPPPPHNIKNVFAAADLLSCSSSDSAKYKHAWLLEITVIGIIDFGGVTSSFGVLFI